MPSLLRFPYISVLLVVIFFLPDNSLGLHGELRHLTAAHLVLHSFSNDSDNRCGCFDFIRYGYNNSSSLLGINKVTDCGKVCTLFFFLNSFVKTGGLACTSKKACKMIWKAFSTACSKPGGGRPWRNAKVGDG